MPVAGRRARDERRRRLGQNFLHDPSIVDRFVVQAGLHDGEFVVEIGAGAGAVTRALARWPVDVLCVEQDPIWAQRLRATARERGWRRVEVVEADVLEWPLPTVPFRVVANVPFGATTQILHKLLDDPSAALTRADVIVQWEVARKRSRMPPSSLVSTAWAPWWEFALGQRIPASRFSPRPRVDAAVLTIRRREPALLPERMAGAYARFVRAQWPFP